MRALNEHQSLFGSRKSEIEASLQKSIYLEKMYEEKRRKLLAIIVD